MYEAQVPEWKKLDRNETSCNPCNLQRNYLLLYLSTFVICCLIWQTFHDIGLSTLLTVSTLIQVVALAALAIAVFSRESVRGISLRSCAMQGTSFALRLTSTCWLRGYIPVDSTGDWLYQLSDFCACSICACICYAGYGVYRGSYQEVEDTFPAGKVCCVCGVLALLVHPDLNNRLIFDSIWTSSLYIDVVSTLPQLWMIGKLGGKFDALSAHYVALVAVARVVDMVFWYHGFEELAPENGGFNVAGWVVLGSHVVHLLLMWDFIYCYLRAIYRGKLLDKQFDFADVLIDV